MGTLRTNVADHSGVVDARVAAKFLKEERKTVGLFSMHR